MAACGNEHTAVVSEQGLLWTWGHGSEVNLILCVCVFAGVAGACDKLYSYFIIVLHYFMHAYTDTNLQIF